MAVAEHAKSHSFGKAAESSVAGVASTSVDTSEHTATIRPLLFSLMLALGMVGLVPNSLSIPFAHADIIADQTAATNQRPIITHAANGVPLVNIQTPSAAGVSRNTYSQFDVNRQGVILNNSRTNIQTQLGGYIQGNPYLAAGTARVILNEVNSSNPSLLNGYVEVAGSRAQLVIANPAGISCNGCGFINANRITLTTGTPLINSGNLIGYRVTGGEINFFGTGLDSSQTNYTDIIARAVNVNAGLFANDLNVVTGSNQINIASNGSINGIVPIAGAGNAQTVSLDVAALGGMYAGKIHLVGTETGLGVRNAGTIGASVGEISITTDGLLQNTGSISAKANIQLDTTALESDGSITADGSIAIRLDADYTHNSELQAGGNLNLQTTGNIINQSTLLASQSLTINAANISNTSTGEIAGLNTQITAAETLTNHGLIDGLNTSINADMLTNTETGSIFGDHLAIQVAHLGNDAGAVIASRDRLDIAAISIENRTDGLIFSAGDLAIGGSFDSNMQVTGSADSLINEGSTIEALGNVTLAVTDIQNLNADLVTQVVVTGTGSFDRFTPRGQGVILESADFSGARIGDVNISTRTAGPYTFREYTRYLGNATTRETQVLSSKPGQILSANDMQISGNLLNSDSQIIAGGNLDISGASVQNLNTQGRTTTSFSGDALYYDYDGSGSGFRYDIDYIGPYNPAPTVTTFNLATTALQQSVAPVGSGTSIAASTVALRTNSLFRSNPNPAANYLIETDPRFADYRTWLSSDFILNALSIDPSLAQKRLGDGFYEQRLIREQIGQLTGRRFLASHAFDEAQYQALMTSAVTLASELQLIPGVALSAAQIAQLTSDIVWLVEQTVTLPDGTVAQALVPQVYVKLQHGDLHSTTGIMAGNGVTMNVSGDITNQGNIAGRSFLSLDANNIHNLGGQLAADIATLHASNNINNTGGSIAADDALILNAGNDINLRTTTQSSRNSEAASSFSRTNIDRVAGLYVSNPDAILVANAGNDFNLMGASIVNSGQNGITQINAGDNINLGTVKIAEQNSSIRNAKNFVKHGGTQEIGSVIETTGDITFNAGNDFNVKAATVNSDSGAINVNAANDINIVAGREISNFDTARKVKKSGTFSSKIKSQRDTFNANTSLGSNFSGDTVKLQSGNDINISGSNVVSDNGTTLFADNNINIHAAQDTASEFHERKTKKSGFSASGSGISYGSQKLDTKQTSNGVSYTGSTVGSVAGDVNIVAERNYQQTASDVIAPQGDVNIAAERVDINAAQNTNISTQETKFKQSGITLSVGGGVIDLAQNVTETAKGALQSDSGRNKLLNTLQTYANSSILIKQGTGSIDAIKSGDIQSAAVASGIKLSLSVGSSSSKSSSSSNMVTHQNSLIKSGGNVTIQATVKDLTVQGSQVLADENITLDAAKNINLIASADTESNRSKNKSSSTSVGVSLGVGGNGVGLSLDLTASRGKGTANSDSVTYNNTQVSAGEMLNFKSGNNTNLIGANASGSRVNTDIGGDLNIQSLQDTAVSQAKQSNTGVSISVPIYGNAISGSSASQSKQKNNSNYASVYQQSSIKAGEQGFDIKVQNNTDLKGALIDSGADANKNHLTTGTLTVSDIQNHMDAKASSSGTTIGSSMFTDKFAAAKGIAGNLTDKAKANVRDASITLSAIAPGEIAIIDSAKQEQLNGKTVAETIVSLNRDTSDTNRVLEKPDIQALQAEVQQQQADNRLLINTTNAVVNRINQSMTANKKILLQKCDAGRANCSNREVPANEVKVINGKAYIFNHGIFNDEEYALANAAQQHSDEANAQGVYVIINPYTGNAVSEVLYAAWDKLNEIMGGSVLPISNSAEANIDIENVVAQQGGVIISVNHSRGALTKSNATGTMLANGIEDGAIGLVIFNGAAANAQRMADRVNTVTSGKGAVMQSTHVDDWVGTLIGGNQASGGINGLGIASHSSYGPNAPPSRTIPAWGSGNVSQPVIIQPINIR